MNRSLPDRTKSFALDVIRLFGLLPRNEVARVLGRQVLRSGTSVGAHAREAFRSRSNAELVSKLEVALQELDETMYWLELLVHADIVPMEKVEPLLSEANELIAILVASVRTVKVKPSVVELTVDANPVHRSSSLVPRPVSWTCSSFILHRSSL
jgi:four helix bundle protein